MNKKNTLKRDLISATEPEKKDEIEDNIVKIENDIAELSAETFIEKIIENAGNMCDFEGSFNNNSMWKLKKKIMPRPNEKITAKKDFSGKLVTNPEILKTLYKDTYVKRLRHRDIKPELLKLKYLRHYLFLLRLKSAKLNKSPEWDLKQLEKVLRKLKSGKSQDPIGLVKELFQEENIGDDLKKINSSYDEQYKGEHV